MIKCVLHVLKVAKGILRDAKLSIKANDCRNSQTAFLPQGKKLAIMYDEVNVIFFRS